MIILIINKKPKQEDFFMINKITIILQRFKHLNLLVLFVLKSIFQFYLSFFWEQVNPLFNINNRLKKHISQSFLLFFLDCGGYGV